KLWSCETPGWPGYLIGSSIARWLKRQTLMKLTPLKEPLGRAAGDEGAAETRSEGASEATRITIRSARPVKETGALRRLRTERRNLDQRVRPEHRRTHAALLRDVAVIGLHDVHRRPYRFRAGRREVQERAEPEDDRGGARGGRADPARREHEAPAARQRERLLQLRERRRPDEARRGHGVSLEGAAPGAAREVRLEHLLGELGELTVEPERDPLAPALADHVVSRYGPHYPI